MLDNTELFDRAEELQSKEAILGKGLMQPFVNSNSGARKVMFGTQLEHCLTLFNPEIPIISTGYENRYGSRSSSIIKLDHDCTVVGKVSKFSSHPDHYYYLIVKQEDTGIYDVIQKIPYNHTTETYGYMFNNSKLDELDLGYTIAKDEIIRSSTAYDRFMNRCDGVNLLTTYISDNDTHEDGIVISETAAKKLTAPLIKRIPILLNDNDIFLNLLGDEVEIKSFPEIGEEMFMVATRREKLEEILYMQSLDRLRDIMMSDDKYSTTGEVIDIEVLCNNPESLKERSANSQVYKHYLDRVRFNDELVSTVNMLRTSKGEIKMSYNLSKLYNRCSEELQGLKFVRDKPDKPFSGTLINLTIMERSVPDIGDKITNRYGGKGIIAKVVPDPLMPLLEDGRRIEAYFNGQGCVNRLNPGQLKEQSINFAGTRLLEYIDKSDINVDEAIDMIYTFINFISPEQAEEFLMMMESGEAIDREWFINSMIQDGYIAISNKPMTESVTLDTLSKIYDAFPFIAQYQTQGYIKDSNGNYRPVPSRRRVVASNIYIYRLKQYAEEKFSVTSLSSTNLRNENAKNKASKGFKSPYSNTPIKFGNMEIDEFDHLGTEYLIEMLMIHSVSPEARLLMEQALTGDPYNVNIVLDSNSKNVQVEIINARLKVMGLRLGFRKIPKERKRAFLTKAFSYLPEYQDAFGRITDEELETLDLDAYVKLFSDMEELASKRAFMTKAFGEIETSEG